MYFRTLTGIPTNYNPGLAALLALRNKISPWNALRQSNICISSAGIDGRLQYFMENSTEHDNFARTPSRHDVCSKLMTPRGSPFFFGCQILTSVWLELRHRCSTSSSTLQYFHICRSECASVRGRAKCSYTPCHRDLRRTGHSTTSRINQRAGRRLGWRDALYAGQELTAILHLLAAGGKRRCKHLALLQFHYFTWKVIYWLRDRVRGKV